MLMQAFAKAWINLKLPGIWRIFLLCLLAYAAGFTVLGLALGWLAVTIIGHDATGFAGMLVGAGTWVLAWFFFPLLYPVLISFFDEQIAQSIEQHDYPHLPPATPPFWPTFWSDAGFALKALGLNLLCLPFYFFPLFNVLLYFTLNGYLLGMQFFRMSAGRRVTREQSSQLQKQYRKEIIFAGALIVLCSMVPILNIIAPVLGVATMLHLFHIASGNAKQELLR